MTVKSFSTLSYNNKYVGNLPAAGVVATKVAATGGSTSTSGIYKVHTFTSTATFTVTAGDATTGSRIEYLIVAGGGGSGSVLTGSSSQSSGGAGGGYLENYANSVVGADFQGPVIFVSADDILTVTVGTGGTGGVPNNNDGNNGLNSSITSSIYSIVALGGAGGAGGGNFGLTQYGGSGKNGGSSSGKGSSASGLSSRTLGYSLAQSPRQGYSAIGTDTQTGSALSAGAGDANGAGRASSISGSSITYSYGGNGGGFTTPGSGGERISGASSASGNTGQNGIVIIRYIA